MKRAFPFGLGTFLILTIILNIIGALVQHDTTSPPSVIGTLVLIPVSVIVIRAARCAPPNYSRLHAVLGWLLGFLVVFAVIAAIGAIVLIIWGAPILNGSPLALD
jgi:cytochrome b561